jgi:HK97 family phage major capsid protein
MNRLTKWLSLLSFAVITFAAVAACAGVLDINTVLGAAMLANAPLAADLKSLEKECAQIFSSFKAHTERQKEEFADLRAQVIELAQRGGTKASDPAAVGASMGARLADQICNDAGFKQFREGRVRQLSIPLNEGLGFRNSTLTNVPGASQPLVPAHREGSIVFIAHQPLRMRDLLPVRTTRSNSVEFPQQSVYQNNARPQGDSSPGGVEGEAFAESSMSFTLASAPVVTLGHTVSASQQILDDAQVLGQFLSNELLYGLKLEEEEEILLGDGSAGMLNGLVEQATAYNRGATNDSMIDSLAKAKLQLELANYVPSGVVLNPMDFLSMATAKDSQSRYLWGDPKSNNPPTVWNIPIVISNSMTAGRFLMADFVQAATIWDRTDAMVEFSTGYQDYFARHLVMVKCWERLTLTVQRPTAMVFGATSHAG